MKLPEICIRQPVLAAVMSIMLVILGYVGFKQLEIRFFPRLKLPIVHVYTYDEGVSAADMEQGVTKPIENAIYGGVDHIDYMSSSSGGSSSSITVQFQLGGNLEQEVAKVRDSVASVKLPDGARLPSVSVGNSGGALVGMTFVDNKMKLQDIREYLINNVAPVLTQVKGVAGVGVHGSTDYAMRVWLDSSKMAARDITVTDIKTAISNNNQYFPAGAFRGVMRNYSIVSDARIKDAQQLLDIIIKKGKHSVVRLGDIAQVKLGMRGFYDLPMHIGTDKGLVIEVSALSSANPIKVAGRVVDAFNKLKPTLPVSMHSSVLYNDAHFLRAAIDETFMAILQAIALVVLVVILFLGSFRAASIAIVTIPISLMAVFFIIKCLGFSINVMSLLAMVLAIGLVVDDAIVMLENIHRHIEQGQSPIRAALIGSKEIAFPIIIMALTLVAVYAPVGLVHGYTSGLFKQFAFTLASAVLVSAFVALTLSPMMCSRVLLAHGHGGGWMAKIDAVFNALSRAYKQLLVFVLRRSWLVIVSMVAIALLGGAIFTRIHAEFIPKEDYGRIEIGILAPGGTTLQYTEKYANRIMARLSKIPEIQQTKFQMNGGYIGISCYLKSWEHRHHSSAEVAKSINSWMHNIPGVDAIAVVPDVVSYGAGGRGVTISFTTTGQYQSLLVPIHKMMGVLKKYPGVQSPSASLKFDAQQFKVVPKRDLAAELGVSLQNIADTWHIMMSGLHWTDVQNNGRSYEIILQMKKHDLMSFNSLDHIYVPTATANAATVSTGVVGMVPISSLVDLVPSVAQSSYQHFDRARSGSVSMAVAPGYTESEVIHFVQQHLSEILSASQGKGVSHAYKIRAEFSGKAAEFLQSNGSMLGVLLLSFTFIYLMLAAQFGSFLDPFVILFAVPLSMVGGLLALWLSGGTFSLYSQIGMVTLVGLISKHGILITKFINDLREQGVEFKRAILRGAAIRLRPVLMTTIAMIFGTLPLVIANGPGAIGRHQIGWTLVGGLFFGTFFSLVVVPVAYFYLGRFKSFTKNPELES